MERQGVVETPPSVWKTDVIPLNYWRISCRFSRRCLLSHPTTLKSTKGPAALGPKEGHCTMRCPCVQSTRLSYRCLRLSTYFSCDPLFFHRLPPFFRYPTCRVDAKRIPLPMGPTSGAAKPGQIIKMRRLVSIHSIASVASYCKHFLDLCGVTVVVGNSRKACVALLLQKTQAESVSYVYVPLQTKTPVFPAPYPWVSPPTCPLPPACLALRTRGPTAPPPAGRAVN